MLTFGLFGAGRIGNLHAHTIAHHPEASLKWVYDPIQDLAEGVATLAHAQVAASIDEILSDDAVDAVIIASATDTHVDLLVACTQAGKAVFCEKPIDLDLAKAEACAELVRGSGLPVMLGFNRRFDPGFREVHDALGTKDLGVPEILLITSRDPSPPPLQYVRTSGGLFRDMTIHDFDMARWLLKEEITEVFAAGSCLVDAGIASEADIDTAAITLKTASGRLCQINNSRRAVYGYDQRIEVHGSHGKMQSREVWEDRLTPEGSPFFVKRYYAAYVSEMAHFIQCTQENRAPEVTIEDGLEALRLAEAAGISYQEQCVVSLSAVVVS